MRIYCGKQVVCKWPCLNGQLFKSISSAYCMVRLTVCCLVAQSCANPPLVIFFVSKIAHEVSLDDRVPPSRQPKMRHPPLRCRLFRCVGGSRWRIDPARFAPFPVFRVLCVAAAVRRDHASCPGQSTRRWVKMLTRALLRNTVVIL